MLRTWRYAAAIVALGAVGLAFTSCAGDDDDAGADSARVSPVTTTSAGGGTTPAGGGGGSTEGQVIKVKLTDNKFEPAKIEVKAGTTVTFETKNEGQAVHNMKILAAKTEGKDFTGQATVSPGSEDKFTAKFTKKGTLKFQCDYHMPDMVGTIEVK